MTNTHGANRLVASRAADLVAAVRDALAAAAFGRTAAVGPELWDGRAAVRVVAALGESTHTRTH